MPTDDDSPYVALVQRYRQLGFTNAEYWARSEINENMIRQRDLLIVCTNRLTTRT